MNPIFIASAIVFLASSTVETYHLFKHDTLLDSGFGIIYGIIFIQQLILLILAYKSKPMANVLKGVILAVNAINAVLPLIIIRIISADY